MHVQDKSGAGGDAGTSVELEVFLRLLVPSLLGQRFHPGIRSMLLLFRTTTFRMSPMHFLLWSRMTTTLFPNSRPFGIEYHLLT